MSVELIERAVEAVPGLAVGISFVLLAAAAAFAKAGPEARKWVKLLDDRRDRRAGRRSRR